MLFLIPCFHDFDIPLPTCVDARLLPRGTQIGQVYGSAVDLNLMPQWQMWCVTPCEPLETRRSVETFSSHDDQNL